MFRQRSSPTAQPRTPSGFRAYAVGDIHGRLDLLDQILTMIEQDAERSPARKSLLIFLGDLIDRGPDSRGVVERLRTYRHGRLQTYFLAGNHDSEARALSDVDAGQRGFAGSQVVGLENPLPSVVERDRGDGFGQPSEGRAVDHGFRRARFGLPGATARAGRELSRVSRTG